jgi:hypothetical protein
MKRSKKGAADSGSGDTVGRKEKPRTGMPAEDSVRSTKEFTSPKSSKRYRIITTDEKDAYDKRAKQRKKS